MDAIISKQISSQHRLEAWLWWLIASPTWPADARQMLPSSECTADPDSHVACKIVTLLGERMPRAFGSNAGQEPQVTKVKRSTKCSKQARTQARGSRTMALHSVPVWRPVSIGDTGCDQPCETSDRSTRKMIMCKFQGTGKETEQTAMIVEAGGARCLATVPKAC